MHTHKVLYGFVPCLLFSLILSLLHCSELPPDPYLQYDNAVMELVALTPSSTIMHGDTVTYEISLSMPHLFSSISISANDIQLDTIVDISQHEQVTYVINQVLTEPGIYYVTISGVLKNGVKRTESAKITVNGDSPVITEEPAALTFASSGATCTLTVAATGTGSLQYQWYFENAMLASENSVRLIMRNFTKLNEGVYKCVVSNNWGADTSVNAALVLSDTVTQTSTSWKVDKYETAIYEGDSVKLALNNMYTNTSGTAVTISLLQASDKNVRVSDSLFCFTAMNRDSGNYKFMLLLSDGISRDTFTYVVTVDPRYCILNIAVDSGMGIVSTVPQSSQYRWGDTVTITATSKEGYIFYQWDGDFSGTEAQMKTVITKNLSIIARFWPVSSASCDEVSSKQLAVAIKEYSAGSMRPKQLCPQAGTYDNGKIKLNGGVRVVLQK